MKTNWITLSQTKAVLWRLGQSCNASRLWSRASPGPVQRASSECRIFGRLRRTKMKLISFLYRFLPRAVLHFPSTQRSHFSVTVLGVNVAIDFLVDVLGSYFRNRPCVQRCPFPSQQFDPSTSSCHAPGQFSFACCSFFFSFFSSKANRSRVHWLKSFAPPGVLSITTAIEVPTWATTVPTKL